MDQKWSTRPQVSSAAAAETPQVQPHRRPAEQRLGEADARPVRQLCRIHWDASAASMSPNDSSERSRCAGTSWGRGRGLSILRGLRSSGCAPPSPLTHSTLML